MPQRGQGFYDPIVQYPEGTDLSRIELAQDESGKWYGRKIGPTGQVEAIANGDFQRDVAHQQAIEAWPGLEVYEAREEEDTTWTRPGPSPRIWAQQPPQQPPPIDVPSDAQDVSGQPPPLMVFPMEAGQYVRVEQIIAVALFYADEYDAAGNPSAALALRGFAEAMPE